MSTPRDVTPYWESFEPAAGVRPARAWLRSDAPRLCALPGQLGRSGCRPGPGCRAGLHVARVRRDAGWRPAARPSTGSCRATAARVHERALPFPVDPPFVPDENPTGDYRASSTCPTTGRAARRCCGSRASTRARGSGSTATELGHGQPAAGGVRRRRLLRPRRQRAGGPGAPVVVRQLPGGPGHVVDVRDLPRRDAAGPARPAASTTCSSHADYDHRDRRWARCGSTCDADAPARSACPELGVRRRRPATIGARARSSRGAAEDPAALRRGAWPPTASGSRLRIGFRTVGDRRTGVLTVNGRRVAVARGEPARVRPGPRPGGDPRDDAPRRAADEAAQHQRRAHQPLPAAPATSWTCATSWACGWSTSATWRRTASSVDRAGSGNPVGRPRVAPALPGPRRPDGRARQEPPVA